VIAIFISNIHPVTMAFEIGPESLFESPYFHQVQAPSPESILAILVGELSKFPPATHAAILKAARKSMSAVYKLHKKHGINALILGLALGISNNHDPSTYNCHGCKWCGDNIGSVVITQISKNIRVLLNKGKYIDAFEWLDIFPRLHRLLYGDTYYNTSTSRPWIRLIVGMYKSTYNVEIAWEFLSSDLIKHIHKCIADRPVVGVASGLSLVEAFLKAMGSDITATDIGPGMPNNQSSHSMDQYCNGSTYMDVYHHSCKDVCDKMDHPVALMIWPPHGECDEFFEKWSKDIIFVGKLDDPIHIKRGHTRMIYDKFDITYKDNIDAWVDFSVILGRTYVLTPKKCIA
jgi:hypothetical protein